MCIISSVLGGIIAVVIGISQLEKYQENWILYRTTTELLKKEKYFYENATEPGPMIILLYSS